jgi:hypothetical protein
MPPPPAAESEPRDQEVSFAKDTDMIQVSPGAPNNMNMKARPVSVSDPIPNGAVQVPKLAETDPDPVWGLPAGLPIRRLNDENLVIFRRAVGINSTLAGSTDPESLEEGRKKAVGIYAAALRAQRRKKLMYRLIGFLIYVCHFAQIIIGASLTAL